jgi:D-alanyl-D-alanine dipeptidase
MNKQATYRLLEARMLRYTDLVSVPVRPNQQKLIPITVTTNLVIKPIDKDMQAYTGDAIYVREAVANKLEQAAKLLATSNPNLSLQVVYGYRALSIQQKLFLKYKKQLKLQYTGNALLEAVHRLIAVPEIAGHPTGGAIDIQILHYGECIDMGTNIWEFTNDSFTFSPFVGKAAYDNRQLLRNTMMEIGFAPFDGEWWHFSYGDKEWAKYYAKPCAIYEQIEFKIFPNQSKV